MVGLLARVIKQPQCQIVTACNYVACSALTEGSDKPSDELTDGLGQLVSGAKKKKGPRRETVASPRRLETEV
jgi:hypothetical protein